MKMENSDQGRKCNEVKGLEERVTKLERGERDVAKQNKKEMSEMT